MVFAIRLSFRFLSLFGTVTVLTGPFVRVRLLFPIALISLSNDLCKASLLLLCCFERAFIIVQFIDRFDVLLCPDIVLVFDKFSHLVSRDSSG